MRQKIQLTIVTGMSGAGKTIAIQSLEDMGYFCVDNLPTVLIPKIIELLEQSSNTIKKIALVLDLRAMGYFDTVLHAIAYIKKKELFDCQIVFLEAKDEVLVQRYKLTRRKHPLAPEGLPLEGIRLERELLQEYKGKANQIIDTSHLKPRQLREIIAQRCTDEANLLTLNVMSFGFKYGIPMDADLVFDVRFLDNPFYVDELRSKTGLEAPVADYVLKFDATQKFITKLEDLLDFLLPKYKRDGSSQVVVAIGCTGGKHRSVTVVEHLNEYFKHKYVTRVTHRDIELDKDMYLL